MCSTASSVQQLYKSVYAIIKLIADNTDQTKCIVPMGRDDKHPPCNSGALCRTVYVGDKQTDGQTERWISSSVKALWWRLLNTSQLIVIDHRAIKSARRVKQSTCIVLASYRPTSYSKLQQ